MTSLKVLNLDLSEGKALDMADAIAQTPFKSYMIRDAVVYQQAKERQGTHATLTRSHVHGSTRKLFRQKGTGRARPGDVKAPHRRHGGIALGPQPRSHAIGMNKKVKKHILRMALAEKIRRDDIVVVENLDLPTHKTKDLAKLLVQLKAPRALLVVGDNWTENLALASSNLPEVMVIHHQQLNVYNLLRFPKAVFTREAMAGIQERLAA